jgi:hypothetical protein
MLHSMSRHLASLAPAWERAHRLAYFALQVVTKKKGFIIIAPYCWLLRQTGLRVWDTAQDQLIASVNLIKLFSFVTAALNE